MKHVKKKSVKTLSSYYWFERENEVEKLLAFPLEEKQKHDILSLKRKLQTRLFHGRDLGFRHRRTKNKIQLKKKEKMCAYNITNQQVTHEQQEAS